jgi:hypothetical protein
MTRYLATGFGNNIPLAIKCVRYYQSKRRPFTAVEVKINRHTMKKLADKGILKLVSGKKGRDPNRYIVPKSTIDTLERRFPDEL